MYYSRQDRDDKGKRVFFMNVCICKKEGTRGYYLCAKNNI